MLHVNKNADKFSLWGFIPCKRYLQFCILISERYDPAPIEVSSKSQLLKCKQDLMPTAQNMEGENLFQVGVQVVTHFLHQATVHHSTRDDTLTFCYLQISIEHNIQLPLLHVCISSS